MRMQPCDARLPIEYSCEVPWMPTPLAIPIQRARRGFEAEPPGVVVPASSPAHGEFGAVQAGLTCLLEIWKRPVGVG
jgi:hypothetical protein